MSGNSIGQLFKVTTFGESHGPESKNKQGVILAGGQTGRAGVVLPARHG